MNTESRYQQFALVREMQDTPEVVRSFKVSQEETYLGTLSKASRALLTGEGSSRIFPAKRAISQSLRRGEGPLFFTEGATQALDYPLLDCPVFGASNSGKTKELIRLFKALAAQGHQELFGVTAGINSPLEGFCQSTLILSCGKEEAVAATKSVVEQALFYDHLQAGLRGKSLPLKDIAQGIKEALALPIPPEVTQLLVQADMIYFAGPNEGVAEELTLKTNEIARKKADFLEGTYAAHGIEEVLGPRDVLVLVSPFPEEEDKFRQCLTQGAGVPIIAIAPRRTGFDHSLVVPSGGEFQNYIDLAAGWSLLVETGLALGVNLDKPVRARKVGNEYLPS